MSAGRGRKTYRSVRPLPDAALALERRFRDAHLAAHLSNLCSALRLLERKRNLLFSELRFLHWPASLPGSRLAAEAEQFSIVIRGRSVDGPQRTIRAIQGALLELAFAADETVELHLHGYDRYLTVHPGKKR
jgi:hypothetical protein